ncbi:glycosyltransferase family 39 protein [Paludibacter sp.]|uniref:glycosyltransferase family 39 protein n=1 Tax=Paludibacter sp. TaxID=1898105 RepID=UPI001353FED4|nr:glycosyltransferase family 39 protein [Paludibacter sp.]MTK54024.1 glycosyltransferase family 39 protein [Paludibacter sp.]
MQNKFISFLKAYWILILLVVTKIALQFSLVHPCYELHRDEFLHLDQANHLAFGYISVPPFTSLLSKLIMLLGGGIFWIRFFPAMFGALTIVVVWLMVESLGGKLWAKLLASIAILFSVIARINILYQPNSFEILDWTLIFWALIQYTTTHKNQWLYTMAVFVTLGFYNKYNLIFLLFGLISGYTLSRERKIFITKSLWWAILLITVFIVPNIIWQIMHDFPVIKHLHALQSKQLDHNSGFGFLSDQLKFFASSILIILAGLFCLLFYKPFRSYRFVGICFISTITIFTLLKAKNYYALGLYPVIIAFGSLYTETIFKK